MIKLENSNGSVNIAREVFTDIVGDAATKCFGVRGMAMRSVTDGLVHLLKKESMGKGVYITYNEDSTISIELHIIIEQGVNIPALCGSIKNEVTYKVTAATGVEVAAVDICIDSVIS